MKLEEMAVTVNLSKKEQMIFDYVLRHREEAAVMTGAELAEAAGVGDTTVIRLARTLGFDSLKSFRRFLQEEALSVKQALNRSELPYEKIKNADCLALEEIPDAVRRQHASRAACDQVANGDDKYLRIAGCSLGQKKNILRALEIRQAWPITLQRFYPMFLRMSEMSTGETDLRMRQ